LRIVVGVFVFLLFLLSSLEMIRVPDVAAYLRFPRLRTHAEKAPRRPSHFAVVRCSIFLQLLHDDNDDRRMAASPVPFLIVVVVCGSFLPSSSSSFFLSSVSGSSPYWVILPVVSADAAGAGVGAPAFVADRRPFVRSSSSSSSSVDESVRMVKIASLEVKK